MITTSDNRLMVGPSTIPNIQPMSWSAENIPDSGKYWKPLATQLKQDIRRKVSEKAGDINSVLQKFFMNDCILSGSCISSIFHGEEPKDYDFWLKPKPFLGANMLRKVIQEKHSADILDISENYVIIQNYADVGAKGSPQPCVTANAITFKNKFQLITLEDYYSARKNFDFVHCKPYYVFAEDKFVISERQFSIIQQKRLVPQYPGNILKPYRVNKFMDRGWTQ